MVNLQNIVECQEMRVGQPIAQKCIGLKGNALAT